MFKKLILIMFFYLSINSFSMRTDSVITNTINKSKTCNLYTIIKNIQAVENGKYKIIRIYNGRFRYLLMIRNTKNNNTYIYIINKC